MSGGTENRALGAMRSQVNWALLGLVIERPSYGYELWLRFERLYGDVLRVSGESHIYKALNALESHGMIGGTPQAGPVARGTDRQPKVHYRATEFGGESYQAQLVEQTREARRRSQLLVRQLAVFAGKPQMALEVIDGIEEACLGEAIRAPIAPVSLDSATARCAGLVDRLATEESRLAMEAELPWIEYARSEFRALAGGRGHGG